MWGMQRWSARATGLLAVWMAMTGCDPASTPVGPADRFSPTTDQRLAAAGGDDAAAATMPDDVWAVVQQRCTWCHTTQHPTGGFDFTRRDQSAAVVRAIGTGVQLEMAPLIGRLAPLEKRTLLDWVQRTTGPLPAVVTPARLRWELAGVVTGLPDGATVPGFAFVVEDGWIDSSPWTVATYTDRFGISARGIALNQTHSVDPSRFPQSRNPSSYFVFKGIPWHGRCHDMRLEGDVRVDRWMSVGMQAARLEPTGRANRDYVRLQFDRDAISLRSAPAGPQFLETWPWGGSAAAPGADPELTGTLNASGFYQRNDEWLHFVLTATRLAGGVRWSAIVTRRGTGAVVASLHAMQPSSTPLAGSFFLHAYAAGGKRNWANLVFDASIDRDALVAQQPRPAPANPENAPVDPYAGR
jgi:hypothetical protein